MQWNGVISLRPSPRAWQRIPGAVGADLEAAYGCVDWYLYQDASCGDTAAPSDPTVSMLERTVAAAGAVLLRTGAVSETAASRDAV